MRILLLSFLLMLPFAAFAKNTQNVTIVEDTSYRYIYSTGIPDHKTGDFPNRDNPNRMTVQNHAYRMTLDPQETGKLTPLGHAIFGVAINGVPFDPVTAECWGQERGSAPISSCAWQEEAIVKRQVKLGLDNQKGHVQPNGSYHYHGLPSTLITRHQAASMVGYAADGFSIYAAPWMGQRSSYQLKKGERPADAPPGKYDGTYAQDYEYIPGSGTLDECNGAYNPESHKYYYYVTHEFPFVPRCWKGTPDPSFLRQHNHRPPPAHGRKP